MIDGNKQWHILCENLRDLVELNIRYIRGIMGEKFGKTKGLRVRPMWKLEYQAKALELYCQK